MVVTTTASPSSSPRRRSSSAQQGDDLVAVERDAVAAHGQHPVAVAVEGQAQVGAGRRHRRGQQRQVGGAAAVVDVHAVGFDADRRHPGAEALQDLGRRDGGRAVGAVDDDRHAAEVDRPARDQRLEVAGAALVPGGDRAEARGLGALAGLLEQRLDGRLLGVGELEAVGPEELDAVVREGVVRRADDRARPRRPSPPPARRRRAWAGRRAGRRRRRRSPAPPPARPRAWGRCGACRGRSGPGSRGARRAPRARPMAIASSGVSSRFATPRTPSVPNSRRVAGAGSCEGVAGLPLRELRALARALEAGLLALLDAGVPGEEALAS